MTILQETFNWSIVMENSVAGILGMSESASLLDVANTIEQGISPRAIDRVKVALEMSDQELSTVLGISAKMIRRLRPQPMKKGRYVGLKRRYLMSVRLRTQPRRKLPVVVGDRLFRVAHIFAFATTVLADPGVAREWLRASQIGLNNKIPLELITTEAGAREVEDLLGRIEHGVLS